MRYMRRNSLVQSGLTPLESPVPLAKSFLTGFTLVEMLIVMCMVSVVSLAVFTTFNNGLKIWQKVNQPLALEDLHILSIKFNTDLKNACQFNGISFVGGKDSLRFATLVNSRNFEGMTVGEAFYSYEPFAKALLRYEKDFAELSDSGKGTATNRMNDIDNLKFKYYSYNLEKKEYIWQDEYTDEGLPLAVRIEFTLKDKNGTRAFSKTVSIPISG